MDIKEIKTSIKSIKRTTFGLSIPELKKLAKSIAKDDYKSFLDHADFNDYWLRTLGAFTLGYAKDDIEILLHYFKLFIPFVDDWAVNDALCQSFRHARIHQKRVWDFLMEYKSSKKEFEVRIVAVMLLSHYLNDEYIDKVIKVLNELYTDSYYSRMGVAWAVATMMGKYPEQTMKYLKSPKNKLDNWTFNKSLHKMRESFRVSKEIKEWSKTIKR